MNQMPINENHSWDVLLIGGASGTGKTGVSYRLARHFDVGITEVDDFHIVLETMTTPQQQPILHYWNTNPEAHQLSAEQILELHISVGRVMLPALSAVIANHIETQTPVVFEGDYILPELMNQRSHSSSLEAGRVRAVFLYELDERQIVRNFYLREPEAGEQAGRARVSWLYGQWLKNECERHGLKALPARPWETLLDRIVEAIG
jgi:2-phosphoglycerate kinase